MNESLLQKGHSYRRPSAYHRDGSRLNDLLGLALGLGLFTIFMALYITHAAPSIQGWDSGEMQVLACRGGIAHSIGYPLYLGLASWFCLLPGIEPARGVTLFSSLCVAGSVTALFFAALHASRCFTNRPILPSLAAAIVFGATPVVWSTATTTNVYALFILLANTTLFLILRWHRTHSPVLPLVAGAMLGLMAGAHGLALVVAVAYLTFALVCWGLGRVSSRQLGLVGICLAVAALFGNVFIYWARWSPHYPFDALNKVIGHTLDLYSDRSINLSSFWSSWWFSFSNNQFPQVASIPDKGLADLAARFAWLSPLINEQLSDLVILLAALGFLGLCARAWPLAILFLGLLVLPVAFAAVGSIGSDKQPFYCLVPCATLMITSAVGMANLLESAIQPLQDRFRVDVAATLGCVAVCTGGVMDVRAPREDRSQDYEVARTVREIVDCVKPNSLVFTEWFWVYPLEYEARIRRGYDEFEALETHPWSPSERRFSRRYIDLIRRELPQREIFAFEAEPEPTEVKTEFEPRCERVLRIVSIEELEPQAS